MSHEARTSTGRRRELIERCQHERESLIAATASTLALLPRTQSAMRWIRATTRMLRAVIASANRADR